MSIGLLAVLDDIVGMAKVAAASLDDIAAQATKAGAKAAGIVIDDAAVTPRYVVGFSAAREVPIVWRIALGSLKNKLLFLLPAALALSFLAPWAITPLLMLGGAYLCFEGTEKVYEALFPHAAGHHAVATNAAPQNPQAMEDTKVAAAISTDFILSAEIMAITLATMPESSFLTQVIVLAVVGVALTVIVYGGVALIVKADDAGLAMAQSTAPGALRPIIRGVGRGLVLGMPVFLAVLSVVGTAAMVWVGGGILVHGAAAYGVAKPEHAIGAVAEAAAHAVPSLAGAATWLVTAAGSGLVGLGVGAALIPLVTHVIAPAMRRLRGTPAAHAAPLSGG